MQKIVGDMFLSATIISYLAEFTSKYRSKGFQSCKTALENHGIQFDENYKFCEKLGNSVQIREWIMKQLPADAFSIDSAVIAMNSNRYPLFIDP